MKIGSYKVLKNITFDFRGEDGSPLNIVVVAGINGSGKTSLLEYIDRKVKDDDFDKSGYLKLVTEYSGQKGEKGLLKDVTSIRFDSDLVSKLRMLDDRNQRDSGGVSYFDKDNVLKIVPAEKSQLFASVVGKTGDDIFYLKTENFHYKDVNNLLFNYVNEIVYRENKQPEYAYDKVREIMDEVFKDLSLRFQFGSLKATFSSGKEDFHVYFKNEFSDRIQLSSLSTGEKELITKVFYLEILKPFESIVLIDEPERSLHPKWQQKMVEVYERLSRKYGCQFIIATHSPHIISSVDPSKVFILSDFERDEGICVRNLKKMQMHSLGLEPNRILKEVMGLSSLRKYAIESKIEDLIDLLNIEEFEKESTLALLNELTEDLGSNDPFIIRANHQMKVLSRKKMLA